MKAVVVVNGKGGVGKDTLCDFVPQKYKTVKVSSIDPIKEMALFVGWNGEKTLQARKFLSDLKKATILYNDYPTKYLHSKFLSFLKDDCEIMIVQIREAEQIIHFIESIQFPAITLLIRGKNEHTYGNTSDDNVDNYSYDFDYFNTLPLEEAKKNFLSFFEQMITSLSDY